jgi:hypothetical protein
VSSLAVNPFAKRVPAAKSAAPASNPFAGKKGGNLKEVKRTDSFFNRVEGTAPPKSTSKIHSLNAQSRVVTDPYSLFSESQRSSNGERFLL